MSLVLVFLYASGLALVGLRTARSGGRAEKYLPAGGLGDDGHGLLTAECS
ncbi:MAG: hypothetical protein ACQETZ_07210 [Candidatus Fermentibacterota bacterium]